MRKVVQHICEIVDTVTFVQCHHPTNMKTDGDETAIVENVSEAEVLAVRKSQSKAPKRFSSVAMRKSSNARYSQAGHLIRTAKPGERKFQPTYRMVSQAPLNLEHMYNITKRTVDTAIASNAMERYNPARANRFCQSLAREIQRCIAAEGFDRFRIVAVVTMLEKANQSTVAKLGFLWDAEQDNWTAYHYECRDFVVNALVLGVYYE